MSKPSDDQPPSIPVPGVTHEHAAGWDKIAAHLQGVIARSRTEKLILVVECYPGVDELAVQKELESRLAPRLAIRAADAYHAPEKIEALVAPHIHRDDLPRRFNPNPSRKLSLVNFFDAEPLWRFRRTLDELKSGLVLIVGCGASLIAWGNILIHADLTRREARRRLHRNEAGNLAADNKSASATFKSKRASGIDWPVADRWKRPLIKRWDYVLDTHDPAEPKLAEAADVRRGLQAAVKRPFRVATSSYGSAEVKIPNQHLDCILEENSLLLDFSGWRIEIPAVDLLLYQANALLGEAFRTRFGHEFPIRMDSLHSNGGPSEPLAHGEGWREERLTSSDTAPLEFRRHWFRKSIVHDTRGGINVLKLIEGEEAIVESPARAFEPLVVHLAETLIIPAAVGAYHIRPHGPSSGKEIATVKAAVRIRSSDNRMP